MMMHKIIPSVDYNVPFLPDSNALTSELIVYISQFPYTGILRGKTINDKLIYLLTYDKQNYSLCRKVWTLIVCLIKIINSLQSL